MKKVADILLFCGQSNMQGSTGERGKSRAGNCLEYKYLTDEFVPVQDTVGEDIGEDTFRAPADGCGSLIPAFCKAYARKGGVAIHCAKGATAIHEWLPSTPRYNKLIEKCKKGILSAQENSG